VLIDTDETVAQHWQSLTTPAERNKFLRDNGVICCADNRLFLMQPTWEATFGGWRGRANAG
jgi:hypothetical protein